MAGETEVSEAIQQNPLHIDEAELDALEQEFGAETEEVTSEFAEDESEDPLEEEEQTEEGEEEGASESDVDDGAQGDEEDAASADEETGEESEAVEAEGGEFLVDGQKVVLETDAEIAEWVQKGIHYEKQHNQLLERVENSEFTVNAILNDPINSILELWTANNFGGNYEQARFQMRQMVEGWLKPVWEEELAKPHERAQMQQQRMQQRHQQQQQHTQQQLESSWTNEDIEFFQNFDVQVGEALRAVDLPAESKPLRKWMAQVMRDGVERGIEPDFMAAAHFIKSQQDERAEALGKDPTRKDGRKTGKSKDAAAIEAAKKRRSSPQRSQSPQRGGRRRKEPEYITAREFLTGINDKLGVDF